MAGVIRAAGATNGESRFRRRTYHPIADINVTPLVDVMLVLLIIFMITAPLLQVGVPVDLPKTSAQQVGGKDEPLVVSVNSQGEVFLGEDLARTVQCDGTSVTNFIERAGGKRPGCWSHGRRRLVEAASSGDLVALAALRIIARLFVVERAATLAGDTADQRRARRLEHSAPVLAALRAFVDEHRGTTPPKTPLGRALGISRHGDIDFLDHRLDLGVPAPDLGPGPARVVR